MPLRLHFPSLGIARDFSIWALSAALYYLHRKHVRSHIDMTDFDCRNGRLDSLPDTVRSSPGIPSLKRPQSQSLLLPVLSALTPLLPFPHQLQHPQLPCNSRTLNNMVLSRSSKSRMRPTFLAYHPRLARTALTQITQNSVPINSFIKSNSNNSVIKA